MQWVFLKIASDFLEAVFITSGSLSEPLAMLALFWELAFSAGKFVLPPLRRAILSNEKNTSHLGSVCSCFSAPHHPEEEVCLVHPFYR